MLIKNVKATALRVDHKEGVGRISAKPFSFYQLSIVDDEAKVFNFVFADSLVKSLNKEKLVALVGLRNEPIELDISLYPKGFGIAGSVVGIR